MRSTETAQAHKEPSAMDQYLSNVADSLLTREEEARLARLIRKGNAARTEMIEEMREYLPQWKKDPTVHAEVVSLMRDCPQDLIGEAEKIADIEFSSGVNRDGKNFDEVFLHAALDIAAQKGKYLHAHTLDANKEKVLATFRRISTFVEGHCFSLVQELVSPIQRDGLATKKRVADIGDGARLDFRRHNLRLVADNAKQFFTVGPHPSDILDAGDDGLRRAIDGFDGERGFKFSTYATRWIQQAIFRYLGNHASTIRIPIHVGELLRQARKQLEELGKDTEQTTSLRDALDKLDISDRKKATVEAARSSVDSVSIHQPIGEDSTLEEFLADLRHQSSAGILDKQRTQYHELCSVLKGIIHRPDVCLPEREIDILERRVGSEHKAPETLEEISVVHACTREYVRQLEDKAVKRIHSFLDHEGFEKGTPAEDKTRRGRSTTRNNTVRLLARVAELVEKYEDEVEELATTAFAQGNGRHAPPWQESNRDTNVEAKSVEYLPEVIDDAFDLDSLFSAPRPKGKRPTPSSASAVKGTQTMAFNRLFDDRMDSYSRHTRRTLSPAQAFAILFGEDEAKETVEPTRDVLRQCIERLGNEATATRLHSMLFEHFSVHDIEHFLHTAQPYFERHPDVAEQAAMDIFLRPKHCQDLIRTWIAKQCRPPDKEGKYVRSRVFLRQAEQQTIVVPNVKEILQNHFAGDGRSPEQRSLVELGNHGHISNRLLDVCSDVSTISVDVMKNIMRTPFLAYRQASADAIVLNDDTISHLHEDNEQMLLWAQSMLKPGGIMIASLKGSLKERATPAHFFQKMGVRGRRYNPYVFARFLGLRGIRTEICQASLFLEAQTPEGKQALQEMMGLILPEYSQASEEEKEAYFNTYVDNREQEGVASFNHPTFFLVAHAGPQMAKKPTTCRPKSKPSILSQSRNNASIFKQAARELQKTLEEVEAVSEVDPESNGAGRPSPYRKRKKKWKSHEPRKLREYRQRLGLLSDQEQELITSGEVAPNYFRGEGFKKRNSLPEKKKPYRKKKNKDKLDGGSIAWQPKALKRIVKEERRKIETLETLREMSSTEINERTGEVTVEDQLCLAPDIYATMLSIEPEDMFAEIEDAGLEPRTHAFSLGNRLPVYPIEEIEKLPCVQERKQADLELFGNISIDIDSEEPT